MKTVRKALLLVLCAALLVGATAMGTYAYFTSTDSATNTFTVGKVAITLDEAKVNEYGVEDTTAARVQANEYKLIPGHEYVKDPEIHVSADSENCWLFVKIENALVNVEDSSDTIHKQMLANDWSLIDATNNVYAHSTVAKAGDTVAVFDTFKISGDQTDLSGFKTETNASSVIKVTAYAIQKDGFDTAEDAWNTAKSQLPTA